MGSFRESISFQKFFFASKTLKKKFEARASQRTNFIRPCRVFKLICRIFFVNFSDRYGRRDPFPKNERKRNKITKKKFSNFV